ncbi:MAG: DUF1641 domain-containing protein [Acidimicrobiales bacterium]
MLERIDDPAVAAALITILDNAELLSTLVLGLSGFVERGDTIVESIASGVREMKEGGPRGGAADLPSLDQLRDVAAVLSESLPTLTSALRSPIVSPESVAVVSMLSEAAAEGMARARRADARVTGVLGAVRALKDPDVGRGMGLLIEVAKSLGRRVGAYDPATR